MKRIIFLLILILLFFIILRVSVSIYTLWHKQDVLTQAQQQLKQEQKENIFLHKQLKQVQTPQFLDEQARNKLLLVKPGESDVIIDSNLLKATASAVAKPTVMPFWQQWLRLFFHS